jgi:hypothetical protein
VSPSYVSSKGTIKHVYDVISKISESKKALVETIGFGGILHFPPLTEAWMRSIPVSWHH